ncbi:unnamed protein product [Ambrosiozyma monospora]|uniref:Unnamed protein product n=1 Tax=Ambrosiozyma monospora TaxID=43982 RepID=A0ACB5TUA1_AMBMO|nr:unnamed protein product [Ambrosiozyma monospora]
MLPFLSRCRGTSQLSRLSVSVTVSVMSARCLATVSATLPIEKPRTNPVGIQQLSNGLQSQLFPPPTRLSKKQQQLQNSISLYDAKLINLSHMHLQQHELLGKKCSTNTPINFPVPSLQGKNLSEHFYRVGAHSIQPYMPLIENLLAVGQTIKPTMPAKWEFKSGWTRYEVGKSPKSVPYPLEDELVFDVETMYHLTQYPCLATCYTPKAWYSWCSPYLTGESKTQDGHLIPLGVRDHNKIVVGHNVSYDRARGWKSIVFYNQRHFIWIRCLYMLLLVGCVQDREVLG